MKDLLNNSIEKVNIETQLKSSYLDYAMSVIVGRALPDVRDGLKPVHRRTLFAMHVLSCYHNRAYKKSARIVGDVIGKYHPHGDTSVYDALVRMAQDFSMRYPLIDGQGNFGSIDGDSPAAMRYTEVRMKKIAHELLADIDKDSVNMVLNYDETEKMPEVLPAKIPNLLINGSSGIAVGMATNLLPHNIAETISASLATLRNPDIEIDELMEHIKAPDFPTGAIIKGVSGIKQAYETGRGKVVVYAKHHIQQVTDTKNAIIITELPYQVNKARMIIKIAEMVRDKRITGISDIRDESNKEGIRIVFELKRGETPEVVYNNLLNCSQLKMSYGINMVALVNKKPRLLNLKQILSYFLEHRKEVVSRRTIFDLNKSRNQAHMLEGLLVAVANIDEIISTIRSSKDTKTAKEKLLNTTWKADEVLALVGKVDSNIVRPSFLQKDYGVLEDNSYRLSPQQAQGILELRLQKLTGLEQKNLTDDYKKLIELIIDLADILSNKSRLIKEIEQELEEMQKQYGDERNTEIQEQESELDITDLIAEETVAITMSDQGYIKSQPISEFKTQKRGGKGKISSSLKDTDIINNLVIASNHDKILCFSDKGKVYWLRVLDVPKGSRISKGRPIVNLLPLEKNEVITAILPLNGKPKTKEEEENNNSEEYKYILMATLNGVVKKTLLSQFARPRPSGLIALNINPGDKLITVLLTTGNNKIMMASSSGKVNHFDEKDVRSMGRTATGVRGIRLNENEKMISTMLPKTCELVITVSENGFGKISPISEFPIIKRGGRGVIGLKTSERNGKMIECQAISDEKEFLLISDKGIMVRTRISDVPVQGRSTQGVRLIKLQKGDKLIALSMLSNDDKDNDDIDNNEQESKEN